MIASHCVSTFFIDTHARIPRYYYDNESGLYYLNARYYAPTWRRFISPDDTAYLDTENPNGLNLYTYCNNDPVNYADPSGHSAILTATLILMGIGIAAGLGYAAYTDATDDNAINGSIGWQSYLGYSLLGGAIGAGIGLFIGGSAPALAAFMGKTFTFMLPTFAVYNMGGVLVAASCVAVEITGAQLIFGGTALAGSALLLMTYERKKAAPRIKSNSKKKAYDKAFYKGGKNKPIHHPDGKYGPHFHPADPRFKHWHYYYMLILTLLGIGAENSD